MHHTRRRRRRESRRRGINHYGNTMTNVGGYRHGNYKRKQTRRRGNVWY